MKRPKPRKAAKYPEMRFPKWAARLKHCHVCQKDVRVIEKMGGTICAECRVILGQ